MRDDRGVDPKLVADWWEYWRLFCGNRDERKNLELGRPARAVRAAERVRDIVDMGGPDALVLVDALVEAAPDENGVALVGAGPLEDLVHDHGDELVTEIARLKSVSPRFRSALRSVY